MLCGGIRTPSSWRKAPPPYLECDVLFISFLSSFFICIKPPIALVMRSPNLYQYTAIGGFTHAKAVFLPLVEPGVYFHA